MKLTKRPAFLPKLSTPFVAALLVLAMSLGMIGKASAQLIADLYVGSNSTVAATNFTSGTNSYGNTYVGYTAAASNNLLTVSRAGTVLTNSQMLYVGDNGSGNSLIISNGGQVQVAAGTNHNGVVIGNGATSINNSVLVTDTNSSLISSQNINIGYGGSGSLTISNSAKVVDQGAYIGNQSSSVGSVIVNGGTWNNAGYLEVGVNGSGTLSISGGGTVKDSNGIIGNAGGSSGTATVTGSGSLWTNSGSLIVGDYGTGSLTISGGTVYDPNGYIGYSTSSNGATGSVTMTGGLWSNSSSVAIGNGGVGNLTLGGSGTLSAASGVTIASQVGSVGALNIGSLVGSDAAAGISLVTHSIAFGSGSGTINFNQADTFTLSIPVSGPGSLQQLGSGTTIISGSNSYTGTTLITNGTLVATSTNALGSSSLFLSGGTFILSTNLSVGSFTWNSSGKLALPDLIAGDYLTVKGALSLTGVGSDVFNLSGFTLSATPVELLSFGSGSFTTNEFSVIGVTNYSIVESNSDSLWIVRTPSGNLYVGSNSTVTPTNFISGSHTYLNTYVGYSPKASKNLLSISGTDTTLNNFGNATVGDAGKGNSMVISNGGTVSDVNGYIGSASTSLSNSVLVTGAGSIWSNSGTLTVGNAGGGTLTIANQGNVVAKEGVIIASQVGSSGTLGIGSLPSSSGSGTLTTPSITFGLGKGTIQTTGAWQAGSNAILPGTPLSVQDPLHVFLTNSTLNVVMALGSSTSPGNLTYTFNRSGSSFYEVATTNGQTLQHLTDSTWDNTSKNWYTNSGGPAVVFAPSDNFLYDATFQSIGTLTVPTNGVTANQVNFDNKLDQNITGGTINATYFTKSGSGHLNISNGLSLIGSFSNTGAGSASVLGSILSGAVMQSGTGTLTISGSNSYAGGTVLSGGTIVLGNSSAFGSDSVYVEGNGTISASTTLKFGNTVSILGKSALTLNAPSQNIGLTDSGNISGTGSLVVSGSGTVSLNGTNTFSSGTTVSLGTLAASSLGSGPLLVKAAKGTTASFLDSLGSGTLSIGPLTLGGNGSIGIENSYGSILSRGAVSITGTNNFIDLSGAWTNIGTYPLLTGTTLGGSGLNKIDLTGSLLGGEDLLLGQTTNYDGLLYSFTKKSSVLELTIGTVAPKEFAYLAKPEILSDETLVTPGNGFDGTVSVQAVPEPSSYALLGIGVLVFIVAARRRVS
jgi:T5SS/PEP-CTERM-associated repeat protein/autotransporter-associated beta strand protein